MSNDLTVAWWQTGSWRDADERRRRLLAPDRTIPGELSYFNPQCQHERSSYDILTCDACVAYTKRLLEMREGAKGAVDANS